MPYPHVAGDLGGSLVLFDFGKAISFLQVGYSRSEAAWRYLTLAKEFLSFRRDTVGVLQTCVNLPYKWHMCSFPHSLTRTDPFHWDMNGSQCGFFIFA